MARKVLTNAEMQEIISNGGSVLINCTNHTILATSISQLPDDNEILECFPLVPPPRFDEDDLNANAIGIMGKFFSGSPADGNTIQYSSANDVWEFVPLSVGLGTIGVSNGGTGLSTIPANSILYSGSLDAFSAVTLGSTLEVVSSSINVKTNSNIQKLEFAGNGNLFGTRKRANFIAGSNVTVNVTDDPSNDKVDVTISASSTAGSRWDQIADPTGNLTLTHGSSNTVFVWGNSTANNSLLQLKDSNGNSGNGYILDIVSGTGSSINPFRATVSGTSNGVFIDSSGKLQILGTGIIEASELYGISSNGIISRTGSGFVSRNITTNSSNITVNNGDGVSGNPTIIVGTSVVTGITSTTNVQGNIANNLLTLSWTGRLGKGEQHANTCYTDQSNTYVAGNKQNFVPNSVNAALNIGGISGDPSAKANGDIWLNTDTGKIRLQENGTSYDILQDLCYKKMFSTNSATVNLFEVTLDPVTSTAVLVDYAIHASDGTNVQIRSGSIRFSAVNKAGTIITESFTSDEGIAPSIGTLSSTWNIISGSSKVTIAVTPTTSLGFNIFYVKYYIRNLSEQTITIL